MTAQASDGFIYGDQRYSIAGTRGKGLFEPKRHKLRPVSASSACWRGYICCYAILDNRLVLANLRIGLNKPAPVLFGVEPEIPKSEHPMFNAFYANINHPVAYTGGLLIARGFIRDLYVHMGFHPAWKYEEVHELLFDNGVLTEAHDRSAQMADIRRKMEAAKDDSSRRGRERTLIETYLWIKRCFSRDHRGLL